MKKALLLILLLAACTTEVYEEPTDTLDVQEPIEQVDILEDIQIDPSDVIVGGEFQPKPKDLPDEVGPLICLKLQNMTTPTPEAIGKNAAISLAVGTDNTKPGVYDLGYLIPTGLFRIGRQGLKTPVAVSLKLRGPGGIQSQPLDLQVKCDDRTYDIKVPAMNKDTIFYIDSYGRLYWRDSNHDGGGPAMDWERALVPQHRLN